MPTPIDDDQKAAIATELSARSVATAQHDDIFAAIDAAGFTVVDKTSGTPATLVAEAPCEVYTMANRQGWTMVGVLLKDGLYLVHYEYPGADGVRVVTTPVQVDVGTGSPLVS